MAEGRRIGKLLIKTVAEQRCCWTSPISKRLAVRPIINRNWFVADKLVNYDEVSCSKDIVLAWVERLPAYKIDFVETGLKALH